MIKTFSTFKLDWYWSLLILLVGVYVSGMTNIIYGIDAKIYASISKEMMDSSNWLEVYSKGEDYLDKPPLLFWLAASSFKVFGVSTFSYRIPSLIFILLGTFSTYKLGKLLYSSLTGKIASLLFLSSFAIFLSNLDVKTDSILTGAIVFATWQLIAYTKSNKIILVFGGFFGIALAMLCKGPIGIMIPVLSVGTHLILTKDFRTIFKWQWLIGLCFSFLIISPMLWGLYTQFDAQMPNKEFHLASGKIVSNYSGLKFYLWDQSFGRILGGNEEGWKNDTTPLFFTHTYIWSFLPWSILGILGIIITFRKNLISKNKEWFLLGAVILPFIAFSFSSFKLPHYILPILPFIAILSASYMLSGVFIRKKIIHYLTIALIILFLVGGSIICYLNFSTYYIQISIFILLSAFGIGYYFKSKFILKKTVISLSISISALVFLLNSVLIPSISKFDPTYQVADYLKDKKIDNVYCNVIDGHILDIYTNHITLLISDTDSLPNLLIKNNCLWVNDCFYERVLESKIPLKKVIEIKGKNLSTLSLDFIFSKDKSKFLSTQYLIFI